MDKKTYKKLFNIIDIILWEDWDPISVNDNPQIRDEYSDYTPQIVKLVIENKDIESISKQLAQFTSVDMGLGHAPADAYMEIAQKIKSKTQAVLDLKSL